MVSDAAGGVMGSTFVFLFLHCENSSLLHEDIISFSSLENSSLLHQEIIPFFFLVLVFPDRIS